MRNIVYSDSYTQEKPAVTLDRGDVFRARGGPRYVTEDGRRIDMGSPGVYRFQRLATQGSRRWIEATVLAGGSREHIFVGKRQRSRTVKGLILVAHRVSKMRRATVEKVTGKARRKAKRQTRKSQSSAKSSSTPPQAYQAATV